MLQVLATYASAARPGKDGRPQSASALDVPTLDRCVAMAIALRHHVACCHSHRTSKPPPGQQALASPTYNAPDLIPAPGGWQDAATTLHVTPQQVPMLLSLARAQTLYAEALIVRQPPQQPLTDEEKGCLWLGCVYIADMAEEADKAARPADDRAAVTRLLNGDHHAVTRLLRTHGQLLALGVTSARVNLLFEALEAEVVDPELEDEGAASGDADDDAGHGHDHDHGHGDDYGDDGDDDHDHGDGAAEGAVGAGAGHAARRARDDDAMDSDGDTGGDAEGAPPWDGDGATDGDRDDVELAGQLFGLLGRRGGMRMKAPQRSVRSFNSLELCRSPTRFRHSSTAAL